MNTASVIEPHNPPELLYGSGGFQVRLWTLAQGESMAYPAKPATRSQAFLLQGEIQVNSQNPATRWALGQRLEAQSQQPWQLENVGASTACFLEVCEGPDFPAIPLKEVTETRPWGSFTVLKDEPHYKLKQLMAKPGNRLSLQRHQHREEHWLVTQGQPEVTLDDQIVSLKPGDYIKVPRHSWHRLTNPAEPGTNSIVEIIELQLGDYFGEDDIERREDDYGRA